MKAEGRLSAYLFPGQGSQYVGMGRKLAEKDPAFDQLFRARLAEADVALGFALSEIILNGPEPRLAETAITQPALFVVSVCYDEYLKATPASGLPRQPAVVAGHSLGEYSALCSAGALSFSDGVSLVHDRGRFMQEAVPLGAGGMGAVVGLAAEIVADLCREHTTGDTVVEPAGFNTDLQTVVAGHAMAVDALLAAAKAKGARLTTRLNVSMPSHCSLMRPAADRLAESLASVTLKSLNVPYVPNAAPEITLEVDRIKLRLTDQLTRPVEWVKTIRCLNEFGVSEFIEVGPGKVLIGFQKRLAPSGENRCVEELAA